MRKALLLLSLALVLALGITAVSAQDDLENVDPSGQTVVYWHQYQNDSAQGNTMAKIIEDFNANNEWGITVDASFQGNYSQLQDLINAGIISGELPNLVAGYSNAAASFALDNSAVDLTPYLTSAKWGLGDTPDINQGLLNADTVDGQLLAFPNQSSAQVFAYNQTLLSSVGIDAPPTTIDEFKTDACTVANATGANGEDLQGISMTTDASAFESWVASMGGSIYHDGAFDFSSDAVKATLQMYQDLYNEGCAYSPAEQYGDQTDFNNGVLAFYITSSAGFTYVLGGFNDTGVTADWGISDLPAHRRQRDHSGVRPQHHHDAEHAGKSACELAVPEVSGYAGCGDRVERRFGLFQPGALDRDGARKLDQLQRRSRALLQRRQRPAQQPGHHGLQQPGARCLQHRARPDQHRDCRRDQQRHVG